ncbi:MAG: Ig-like domain-containing protein [Alistipes sp.]|nr:Ig-like domain-containing protein [Alistipes sp.]
MKKISIFLFAAAALLGAGCEDSSDTDRTIPVAAIALDSSLSGGITLVAGQTADISGKVTVRPENATNKTETYESSDPEVASVDEAGLVRAQKPGLAMMTISVGGKHTHFEVKVEAQRIPVESVTLPEELASGVTLKLGATLDLAGKATILPADATDRTESYNSSDPMIAAVSEEGIVSAIALGEATITISADGKAAHFTLTVEKIGVESVTLPEELAQGVTLPKGGTLDIAGKATVKPDNASDRAESYASSDESVATVSAEGLVTAVDSGKTTISITVDGVSASFELTVAADAPVALEKIEIKNGATAIQGAASVVLGTNTTFDLYSQLQLTPANQNEGVKYVAYGPEEVATIDENGIVTCKGVGTVTFVVLAKSNETNDFKNAGDKKAYFAVNVTAPGDLDRTGWEISANSGSISGTAGSKTAAFDGVFDPAVFKDVKGSNFGLSKPTDDSSEVWFVVDMQSERSVNYFRLMHQSCRNTDRSCRWRKFSAILGSNDGENFTAIATDVEVPNLEFATNIDPNDGGSRNIDKFHTSSNIRLPETVKYRYLKFVGKKACFTGTAKTCQIAELYVGLE